MNVIDLPLDAIAPAAWNANEQDAATRQRLRRSIERFGLVIPLVVRSLGGGRYETIGGNQRLGVLREMGVQTVRCVLVQADDAEARLLSQALNHIAGEDNPGRRGELLQEVLRSVPEAEVLGLLRDGAEQLRELSTLGQESIAARMAAWEGTQKARLRHLQVQLTDAQLKVVERAVRQMLPNAREASQGNPNRRGVALYFVCLKFLEGGNNDAE